MIQRFFAGRCIVLILMMAIFGISHADTLVDVKKNGLITIGVADDAYPASYRTPAGNYIGYNVDICLKIIEVLRRELQLNDLQVRYQLINAANRIPFLLNKTTDIDCSFNGISPSRKQLVSFSIPTFAAEEHVMVSREANIQSLADLNNKVVALSPAGSKTILTLRSRLADKGIHYTEVPTRALNAASQMLQRGTASATAYSLPLLLWEKNHANDPKQLVILDEVIGVEPAALMLRLGDKNLLDIVNRVILDLIHTGELEKLYSTWFFNHVAAVNLKLDIQMPALMKEILANPEAYIDK